MSWECYNFFIILLIFRIIQSHASVPSNRIFGGKNGNIAEYPYMASLRLENHNYPRGWHFCGGSIISKTHILTAAHCIINVIFPPFKNITVVTGTTSRTHGGQIHRLKKTIIHPKYVQRRKGKTGHYDIGILTLKVPMKFSMKQNSISLPRHDVHDGATAIVTGWGTVTAKKEYQDTLQKLVTKVYGHHTCTKKSGYFVPRDQICVIDKKGKGSCYGDSGSPLTVNMELVGIVSYGTCGTGRPYKYANVYKAKNFILSQLL